MAAGYSGRTAAQKLGVTAGSRLAVLHADEGWSLPGQPPGVEVRTDLRARCAVILAFVRSRQHLVRNAERYVRGLADDAALWVAWPRRAAGHASDVTEQVLRDVLLPKGLVDVKVAAIDEHWSGLRFVRRRNRRAREPAG